VSRRAVVQADGGAGDKALVVLVSFVWAINWIIAAIALRELSPWSLRFAATGIGAGTLFAAAVLSGQSLQVPRGEVFHIMVVGFFNVAALQVLSGFAQLSGATSRAIIITYSMPIWATLLSFFVLGERLNALRWLAYALCIAGVAILISPLFVDTFPPFVIYSLGCALSWAFGTVYMKWMKSSVGPLVNAAWQLLFGFGFVAAGCLSFEGLPHLWPLRAETAWAVVFVGLFGVGLAQFLWWRIVGRLSPVTASIGSLLVPVIGVTASALVLDERPTGADIVGFIMIFAAAVFVLLPPSAKPQVAP